ncbi:polysaccharide biosynthesis protein [Corynebacterium pseudopelargi]|uniref:UDP-glucose 4-epimerase n=1 Tax=Corynebacterium pseudopelargi TaxID=2080757 RepID=A0A3G6IUE2_9CORY|nr:polysaccharide biosynthesis protein [Corynebacterium pseudopelargi]AZA08238.1 UDP-glucose 4-epimerase [Corynebacterium pseudopelargi]
MSKQSEYDARTVLVTGGTGSFGHTVVERILRTQAQEVRVFSRDEAKQDAMRHRLGDDRVSYVIGDVRDAGSLERAMRGVDHVFHAAALKQVPSCEFFPDQAVATNVLGSQNVLEAAEHAGVRSVVCLSTDKAVYPVNAMGMSKALMEKVARAHARRVGGANTTVSCVRYGNVMYSRGSVIPLFVQQLRQGKNLTLTEPRMTRFMMTLAESVDLVERAFRLGKAGDIFIQKAPATTVGDLAEVMCELFDVPANITTIGVRHGEKLHETLATREELAFAEDLGTHLRLPVDNRGLNYEHFADRGVAGLETDQDFDSDLVERMTREQLAAKLLEVPELRGDLLSAGRDLAALDARFGVDASGLVGDPSREKGNWIR